MLSKTFQRFDSYMVSKLKYFAHSDELRLTHHPRQIFLDESLNSEAVA